MLNIINNNKYYLIIFAIISIILLATFFLLTNVNAADNNFSVDSLLNTIDANPGDGICADASTACTLSAAIHEANTNSGSSIITFDPSLWASGPATVSLGFGASIFNDDIQINGPGDPSINGDLGDIIIDLNNTNPFDIQANTNNIVVSGLEIINSAGACFSINSDNTTISYNHIHECQSDGVVITTTNDTQENIIFSNNIVEDYDLEAGSSNSALDLYGNVDFSNIIITYNTFTGEDNDENTVEINPWVNGSGTNIILSNNTITGWDGVGVISTVNDILIDNNLITSIDSYCITSGSTETTITDNTCNTTSSIAVEMNTGNLTLVDGNTLSCDSTQDSTGCLYFDSENITISDNNIDGGEHSIYSYGSMGDINVDGNTISNDMGRGFGMESVVLKDFQFNNNTISDTDNDGFMCWLCVLNGASISNNTFTNIGVEGEMGNSAIGFYKGTQNNLTIEDNTMTNANIGIWFNGGEETGTNELNNSSISNNTITGSNSAIAFNEEQGGSGNEISSNIINNTTTIAILIDSLYFSDTEIDNNVINTAGTGGINITTSGENLSFDENSISNVSQTGISIGENANSATFSNNTLTDNGISEIPLFEANLFKITYNGEDFYDTQLGNGYYYFLGALNSINNDDTEILEANGINNFDLALLDLGATFKISLFLRTDVGFDRNAAAIEAWCDTWDENDCTVDGYWLDAMRANGTTKDYSWTLGSESGLSTNKTPRLNYMGQGYSFYGYSVANGENTFTNETLEGNGRGFVFNESDNEIIDSSIDSLGKDIKQLFSVGSSDSNTLNNTSFDSYDIDQGSVQVHYKARTHVIDDNEADVVDVNISVQEVDNGDTYDFGSTNISGLTDYTLLENVYILDNTGIAETNNDYIFTAEKDDNSSTQTVTINSVNQQVEMALSGVTFNNILGHVKKDDIGIPNVQIHLYDDINENGVFDDPDELLSIKDTNIDGYYRYRSLENGYYLLVLQPASLSVDINNYELLETNPRVVVLSGEDVEMDFNYTPIVTNSNTNINTNVNTNTNSNINKYVYINRNVNISENTNTNSNINLNTNTNQLTNSNTNQEPSSNLNLNLNLSNLNITTNEEGEQIIEQTTEDDLVLQGKAEPGAKVIITIVTDDGEEITYETIADENGNWKLIIPKENLTEGEHTIYLQTEINGVLSEKIELAKLLINSKTKISTFWIVLIISLILIFILVLLIIWYIKKKKKEQD